MKRHLVVSVLGLAAQAAWAFGNVPQSADAPSGVTYQVQQTAAQPLSLSATDSQPPGAQPGFQATTQTMLWATKNKLSAGVGVEQRWQPPNNVANPRLAAGRDAGVLVGVSLATSERSTLVWQTPVVRGEDYNGNVADRQMRLGLNFHAADPYSDLRRGALMKVELSGPTVFSLKPRGGRLAMVLSSKW